MSVRWRHPKRLFPPLRDSRPPEPSERLSEPQDARERIARAYAAVADALPDWRWPGTLIEHDPNVTLQIGGYYTVVSEPGVPSGDWRIVSARPGRARVVPVPGNVYDVPEPPTRLGGLS